MIPTVLAKYGIRARLLIVLMGLLITVLAILSTSQITVLKNQLETNQKQHSTIARELFFQRWKALTINYARKVENEISSKSFSTLNALTSDLEKLSPELKYAIIMDSDRIALVNTRFPSLQGETLSDPEDILAAGETNFSIKQYDMQGDQIAELICPIHLGKSIWGRLRLGFSLKSLNNEIMANQQDNAYQIRKMIIYTTIFAVISIIVSTAFLIYISNTISIPLVQLTETAQQLAQGNFDAIYALKVKSKNEIGVLTETFIDMTKKITDYIKTLEDSIKEKSKVLSGRDEMLNLTQLQLIESEKNSSLGTLAADVAQEINVPIGISVTAVSHLFHEAQTFRKLCESNPIKRQELDEFIRMIIQNTNMISSNLNLASDLIHSFKQVAIDQTSDEERIFNVKKYLGEIILSLGTRLKKTDHDLHIDCPRNLIIKSYPGAISQIIINLVNNSLIHAFDGQAKGKIRIKVEYLIPELIIDFKDNGKGINPKNLDDIFGLFFTTKKSATHSGIGLYIVQKLITERLKGTIQCESKVGDGTIFTIKFPIDLEIDEMDTTY